MIIVEANQPFTLKDFDKIKDTLKRGSNKDKYGTLYKGDIFECDETMANYLLGDNENIEKVIDIIEIKSQI